MAIAFVAAESNQVAASAYPTSITLNVPAGVSDDDVLLAFVALPRHAFYALRGSNYVLQRRYSIAAPTGWFPAGDATTWTGSFNPDNARMFAFWRVASSEPASYDFPVNQTIVDVESDDTISVVGTMLAYSGVDPGQPIGTDVKQFDPQPGLNTIDVPYDNSVMVQAVLGLGASTAVAMSFDAGMTQRSEPNSFTFESAVTYEQDGETANSSRDYNAEVLTGDKAVNAGEEVRHGFSGNQDEFNFFFLALTDVNESDTDAPPPSGDPDVTGSGALIPEGDIVDPLVTEVWTENASNQLALAGSGSDIPQAVGAQLSFNGIGACVGGTIYFAGGADLLPFVHAVRLKVELAASEPYWYAGVVENTAEAGGLTEVRLKGLFELLNEGQIQTSSSPFEVGIPSKGGVTAGTRNFNGGQDVTVEEGTSDEYQSWSDYLNARFALYPDAAWGVGPDLYYAQGRPQNGGIAQLDADGENVLTVEADEFILPEYATKWWAADSSGTLKEATRSGVGILVPERLVEARVDSSDALVAPAGASLPFSAGPAHTIVYGGLAVPPIQVLGLPDGSSQYAASAEVDINVGEEGRMPVVTTTMRTVALPYRRG